MSCQKKVESNEKFTGYATNLQAKENFKEINYYHLENSIRGLAGSILTIIDASYAGNEIQRKAVKDLIKNEIRLRLFDWQDTFFEGKACHNVPLGTNDEE